MSEDSTASLLTFIFEYGNHLNTRIGALIFIAENNARQEYSFITDHLRKFYNITRGEEAEIIQIKHRASGTMSSTLHSTLSKMTGDNFSAVVYFSRQHQPLRDHLLSLYFDGKLTTTQKDVLERFFSLTILENLKQKEIENQRTLAETHATHFKNESRKLQVTTTNSIGSIGIYAKKCEEDFSRIVNNAEEKIKSLERELISEMSKIRQNETAKAKLENDLLQKLKDQIIEEVTVEIKQQLKQEIKQEINEDLKQRLKKQIKDELKLEIMTDINSDVSKLEVLQHFRNKIDHLQNNVDNFKKQILVVNELKTMAKDAMEKSRKVPTIETDVTQLKTFATNSTQAVNFLSEQYPNIVKHAIALEEMTNAMLVSHNDLVNRVDEINKRGFVPRQPDKAVMSEHETDSDDSDEMPTLEKEMSFIFEEEIAQFNNTSKRTKKIAKTNTKPQQKGRKTRTETNRKTEIKPGVVLRDEKPVFLKPFTASKY